MLSRYIPIECLEYSSRMLSRDLCCVYILKFENVVFGIISFLVRKVCFGWTGLSWYVQFVLRGLLMHMKIQYRLGALNSVEIYLPPYYCCHIHILANLLSCSFWLHLFRIIRYFI